MRLKPGLVSPLSSSITDVVPAPLSLPPINMIPCGDLQALWYRLSWAKLWDWIQVPVAERVWQVALAGESTPPHAVTPVWEWRRLREGRSGRKQILEPLV